MHTEADKAKWTEYRTQLDASLRYARDVIWPRYRVLRDYWRKAALQVEEPAEGEFVRSAVIHPIVESKTAALVPRNPKCRAVPRKEFFTTRMNGETVTLQAEKTIPVVEKVCDYDIEQCDLRGSGKRGVREGQLLGLGCIEVGWDPWFGKKAIVERRVQTEYGEEQKGPQVKTALRYQEFLRRAAPFYRYRRAEDVLQPAFCQDHRDAPFLILRNRRLLYEAVNDPNYQDMITDKQEFANQAGMEWMKDEADGEYDALPADAKQGMGRLCMEYHFWHKADNVYAVFVDGVDEPVRWGPWPWPDEADGIDGFPLKLYVPLESPVDGYGVAPASFLISQQVEKNRLRSKMAEMVAKWKNLTLANMDASGEEIDRIKRAEEGSIVQVDSTKNFLPLPAMMDSMQHLLAYEARIADDVRMQSGVTDFQMARGADTNFATDSALIQQASSAKAEDERVAVRKFLADVVKTGFQLRQQLMTGEESVRITGEGKVEWLSFTAEQITGEFDLHLEVEEAPSDAQRAGEEAKMLLEGFYGKPEADNAAVLRRMAKLLRLPGDELVKGVDNFAARREAEYENEMLIAGLGAEIIRPSPQENFAIHVQSHTEAAQRAQAEGADPSAILAHLDQTMQVQQMISGEAIPPGAPQPNSQAPGGPGGGKTPVNKGTGQMVPSGKQNQPEPAQRVAQGDVGALRSMGG